MLEVYFARRFSSHSPCKEKVTQRTQRGGTKRKDRTLICAKGYVTPTGLGKKNRFGSYKHITPTGFGKVADNTLPPAAGSAKKHLSRRVAL